MRADVGALHDRNSILSFSERMNPITRKSKRSSRLICGAARWPPCSLGHWHCRSGLPDRRYRGTSRTESRRPGLWPCTGIHDQKRRDIANGRSCRRCRRGQGRRGWAEGSLFQAFRQVWLRYRQPCQPWAGWPRPVAYPVRHAGAAPVPGRSVSDKTPRTPNR
jgi:hypothetical protein